MDLPPLALVPHDPPGVAPAVLDQIAQLLAGTPCQHCGRPPYRSDPGDTTPDLDQIDPVEQRHWRQVTEAEKIRAAAPREPAREQLETARTALTQARDAEQALRRQIVAAEENLADPLTWLRPGQRMTLANQLPEHRKAIEAIRRQVAKAEQRVKDLEDQRDQRRDYFTRHRAVLDAGRRAQEQLNQRVDELVHAYARLPVPPPWFTYGLGYPPKPEEYPAWLRRARAVVAYRRRYGIDHPLEPLGRGVPEKGTPRYEHWRAAGSVEQTR